jgi:hypothetical protein
VSHASTARIRSPNQRQDLRALALGAQCAGFLGGGLLSFYCELYRQWQRGQDVVLRQEHKAGEKMFVDWQGAALIPPGSKAFSPMRMLRGSNRLLLVG